MSLDDLLWRQVLARMTVGELLALKAIRSTWEDRQPEEREREHNAIFVLGDATDCADCSFAAKYHGAGDGKHGAPCLLTMAECSGYRPGGEED